MITKVNRTIITKYGVVHKVLKNAIYVGDTVPTPVLESDKDVFEHIHNNGIRLITEGDLYTLIPEFNYLQDWVNNLPNWLDVKPTGGHNTLRKDFICKHKGDVWKSNHPHNSWEPAVTADNLWIRIMSATFVDPDNLCDTAETWSSTTNWNIYIVGDYRKHNGKIYKLIAKAWGYIAPDSTYGNLGWEFVQDCTVVIPPTLCDSPEWDVNQNWTTYVIGQHYKRHNKVYRVEVPQWCYYDPAGAYGHLGWIWVQDCN